MSSGCMTVSKWKHRIRTWPSEPFISITTTCCVCPFYGTIPKGTGSSRQLCLHWQFYPRQTFKNHTKTSYKITEMWNHYKHHALGGVLKYSCTCTKRSELMLIAPPPLLTGGKRILPNRNTFQRLHSFKLIQADLHNHHHHPTTSTPTVTGMKPTRESQKGVCLSEQQKFTIPLSPTAERGRGAAVLINIPAMLLQKARESR